MNSLKTLCSQVLILTILALGTSIQAQRMWIPEVEIEEGDAIVDVPIYMTGIESFTSVQLSTLWDSEKIQLDTLIFAPHLNSLEQATMAYNIISEQEMRAVFFNSPASPEIDPFAPDSLVLTMRFRLTDKFDGIAEVVFNPNFRILFARSGNHTVFPELNNGSIFTPGNTTSIWSSEDQASVISLFPNPVTRIFNLKTEDSELKNMAYTLIDVLGRQVDRGHLINGQGEIPSSLPNGTYFLRLERKTKQMTAKLVLKR